MACREGCRTKDHVSYAECLRAGRPQMKAVMTSPRNDAYSKTKSDLSAYKNALANGIHPGGTTLEKVRQAEEATRLLGRPYDGNTDPPADLITTKTAAKFVNWKE